MTIQEEIDATTGALLIAQDNLFRTTKRIESGASYNPYPEYPDGLPSYKLKVSQLTNQLEQLKQQLQNTPPIIIPENPDIIPTPLPQLPLGTPIITTQVQAPVSNGLAVILGLAAAVAILT